MRKRKNEHGRARKWLPIALMGAATYAVKTGLMKILRFRIILCGVPILMAVAVYAVLLIRLGCISEEELVLFPKGTSLVRLAKRLHLM